MPEQWVNFFIAGAGASAALTGLVIVAISVNISRILAFRHLPSRAAAAVCTLMLILLVSMEALITQSMRDFGAEALFFSIISWLVHLWSARQMLVHRRERSRPWYEAVRGIAIGQLQAIPFVVGSSLLTATDSVGFYWIAAGTIVGFLLSMFTSWILLVEILR